MPETEKPTYNQGVWEQKLALMRQQMQDSLVGDAPINRQVKNLKRKDFGQQRNMQYADVEYTADQNSQINKAGAWRSPLVGMGSKRISSGASKGVGSRSVQNFSNRKSQAATTSTKTGTTTVLNPAATWTTEGWTPLAAATPEERGSLRVLHKNESMLTPISGVKTEKSMMGSLGKSQLGEKFKKAKGGAAKGSGDPNMPLSVSARSTVPGMMPDQAAFETADLVRGVIGRHSRSL